MRVPLHRRSFSLIEVVVAIALFAGSVTVILALLPGLANRGAETADRLVAQRLPGSLQVELRRLAAPGIGGLAGRLPLLDQPLAAGLAFVATREGANLQLRDDPDPGVAPIADGEQYYLIECWRFADDPLRFDPATHALAIAVRVSWPYRAPGATSPTAVESRHELTFVTGVNQ